MHKAIKKKLNKQPLSHGAKVSLLSEKNMIFL